MNPEKDIKPISYFRSNSADVLTYINDTHNTMYITQKGEVKGVLTDPVTHQETQDALNILRVVGVHLVPQLKHGSIIRNIL